MKLRWLKKLYKDAKNAEIAQADQVNPDPQAFANPFDEQRFEEYETKEFDNEVNNLIEWIDDLDYDKYQENWKEIATSGQTDMPNEMEELNEEMFLQDNENYETKLKEHLYLFDDKDETVGEEVAA